MEKMRSLITAFPEQLRQAWEIAQSTPIDLERLDALERLDFGHGRKRHQRIDCLQNAGGRQPCAHRGQQRLHRSRLDR